MSLALGAITQKEIIAALIWGVSVVGFSAVYFIVWRVMPDAFIVNAELNVIPYWNLVANAYPGAPEFQRKASRLPNRSIDLAEFSRTVREIEDDIAVKKFEAENSSRRLEVVRQELSVAVKEHNRLLGIKMAAFEAENLSVFEEALRLATDSFHALELDALPHVRDEASSRLKEASRKLQEKRADIAHYMLKNQPLFRDPVAFDAVDKKYAELMEVMEKNIEANDNLFKIHEKARRIFDEWSESRLSRLNWLDFLYFSAGVSTTVTFGDVTPNRRSVRMMVLFQIVISVLTVGYFVSQISSAM